MRPRSCPVAEMRLRTCPARGGEKHVRRGRRRPTRHGGALSRPLTHARATAWAPGAARAHPTHACSRRMCSASARASGAANDGGDDDASGLLLLPGRRRDITICRTHR
eukprot:scaffold614_cov367-Prasinococcus_capsulatus_cf.AAC.9